MSGRAARISDAARAIARDLRHAGVIWHDCDGCGLPWPFPTGFHVERDWRCHRCVQATVATLQRKVDEHVDVMAHQVGGM